MPIKFALPITVITSLICSFNTWAQQSNPVEIKTKQVSNRVYMLVGQGGNIGLITAADQMLALSDAETKIIPGHGPLASAEDLKRYRDMLATVYGRLLAFKNQGMSADEVLFEEPLAEFEDQWGGGIFDADQWIEIVYPAVY